MKVHVVHGILDPVGTSGLLGLVPYLKAAGFDCRVPDYGLITAVEARLVNPLLQRAITPYIEPGDVWIGHSNGCAIGYQALRAGAPLAGLVLINGALDRDIVLPPDVWADVYYNAGDMATVAAEVGDRLGLLDPVWGAMGHAGYRGSNPLIGNWDCGHPASPDIPAVDGHGDIFTPAKLAAWGPIIVSQLRRRLASSLPQVAAK